MSSSGAADIEIAAEPEGEADAGDRGLLSTVSDLYGFYTTVVADQNPAAETADTETRSSGQSPDAATTTNTDLPATTTTATATTNSNQQSRTGGKSVLEVFVSDETDVTLITGYSGAIAYLNASATPSEGDICATSERIIGWCFYGLVIVIYCLRHFVTQRKKYASKPTWFRVLRCLVFCLFLLTLNEQPLTCEVTQEYVKEVRYAQAALWTGLALFASQVLVLPKIDTAVKKRREKKRLESLHATETSDTPFDIESNTGSAAASPTTAT